MGSSSLLAVKTLRERERESEENEMAVERERERESLDPDFAPQTSKASSSHNLACLPTEKCNTSDFIPHEREYPTGPPVCQTTTV